MKDHHIHTHTHKKKKDEGEEPNLSKGEAYFIVDFKIGASHFEVIRALVTLNHVKYGIQAENHQSRVTSCSNHCICFAAKSKKKKKYDASLSQMTKKIGEAILH